MFRADFQIMAESGTCTLQLWSTMVLVQLVCQGDTQEVESFHAQLQVMARRAPHMMQALANARMLLKFGKPLTPNRCCELHRDALAHQNTDEHANRFGIIPFDDLKACPSQEPAKICPIHADPAILQKPATIVLQMGHAYKPGAKYTYLITAIGATNFKLSEKSCESCSACLINWSYNRSLYGTKGSINKVDGAFYYTIKMPLEVIKVIDLLRMHMMPWKKQYRATIVQCGLLWLSGTSALVKMDLVKASSFTSRNVRKKKQQAPAADIGAIPIGDVGTASTASDVDSDSDEEGSLEQDLARIMEEDAGLCDFPESAANDNDSEEGSSQASADEAEEDVDLDTKTAEYPGQAALLDCLKQGLAAKIHDHVVANKQAIARAREEASKYKVVELRKGMISLLQHTDDKDCTDVFLFGGKIMGGMHAE